MKKELSKSEKRFLICISVLIAVILCLFALSTIFPENIVSTKLGIFSEGDSIEGTSQVNVDINGGETIIKADEYAFEPGVRVQKEFYITNKEESSDVVYGFTDVSGELGDYLIVTLKSGDDVLYSGSASNLGGFNADEVNVIKHGQTKNFTILFEYPSTAGNDSANKEFSFRVCCGYAD